MQVNERRKRNSKKLKTNDLGFKSRKIPKDKLENVLNLLNDPNNEMWKFRSIGCETPIHNHNQACAYNTETTDMTNDVELRIRLAQTCLLRRQWKHLSKIILLYKPQKSNENYILQILAKYASISFAYSNQRLLQKILQSFNQNTENVLRIWTSLCEQDATSPMDDTII